jgi:hypothetical protein
MNANDVIESYVTDVALQLPRRQRNDVAFELRALLNEELQARAEAAGRGADAAMATEFLGAFGRPAEVAARYRPTLTIIDPADGRSFLRATVIGMAVIWILGLVGSLRQPIDSGGWDLLSVAGHWWGSAVIPSLWWPGMLVVGFGTAAWVRRRWPQSGAWKPRAGDRIEGGRTALVLGLIGIVCGIYVLIEPRWLLDVVWDGRAAPAAYEALTYTETFRQRQAPWLLALLLLNIPILATVVVQGRWSAGMRRFATAMGLATCAAMVWTIVDGPVLMTPSGDGTAKGLMGLIVAISLLGYAIQAYRRVRPAPG